MSYWTTKECEFCGKEFKGTRRDARFCPDNGGKCRVANSRREKKRIKAAEGIKQEWSPEVKKLYTNIVAIQPEAKAMILDMVSATHPKQVEDAVILTSTVLTAVQYQLGNKIERKEQQIENLEAQTAVLDQVRDLVNGY